MFSLATLPDYKFSNPINLIAYEQVQQYSNTPIDPAFFIESNPILENFDKVLSTHCVVKNNLKPVFSILILATNQTFNNLVVFQYIVKPQPLKKHINDFTLSSHLEIHKIWEIGKIFSPENCIQMFDTLYKSNSPRLIFSKGTDVFFSLVQSRSNDFINKDYRSLGISAMFYEKKCIPVELTQTITTDDESLLTIDDTTPFRLLSKSRLGDVLLQYETSQSAVCTVGEDYLVFTLSGSNTSITLESEYIRKNSNTAFQELIYLAVDPYTIITSFKKIGVLFESNSYNYLKQAVKNMELNELLSFKGFELHFDIVITELYRRKFLN